MRKGIVLSVFMHFLLVLFLAFNLSGVLVPEPEITYINVQLITDPNAARTAKPTPVKPVKSQQSAAPASPQPQKKQTKPKKDAAQVVDLNKAKNAKAEKIKPKEEASKEAPAPLVKEEPISRPPVLDKTPNKKPVIKEDGKPTEKPKDSFLEALDFIDDIKEKVPALAVGPEGPQTVIYDETQKDVAFLKRHIERNWYRPPGLEALDQLQVIVQIEVNRDGTISGMEIIKPSGRKFFDNSILRAVRKSVPLPIPPEQYDIFKTIQISFNR